MLYCEQAVGPSDLVGLPDEKSKSLTISDIFPNVEPTMIRRQLEQSPADIETMLENGIEEQSRLSVEEILDAIERLTPLERLLLYLKLSASKTIQDPLKQPTNPLGSRPEISLTVSWIKTHLQEDTKTSLPKQDVYNEYLEHCHMTEMKPLSTADFGKVMKQVYPNMRPRRLGTRGNSRYCYSGLSSRAVLPTPTLPILPSLDGTVVCRWAAKVLAVEEGFSSIADLEYHLLENNLVPKKLSPSAFDHTSTYDKAYAMSSKIVRQEKKVEDGRKFQDESPCTSKGAPERCKGKRAGSSSSSPRTSTPTVRKTPSSSAKRSSVMPTPTPTPTSTPVTPVTSSTPAQEEITMISPPACGSASSSDAAGALSKLPIPRLPKISSVVSFANNTPLPVVKRHKHIVPKDLLGDSNNSFEQEEELLNYFRRQGDDDSKTSTLRMLLERNKDTFGTTNVKAASVCSFVSSSTTRSVSRGGSAGAAIAATVRRRVSFDPPPPPPDTPKKFSFVPISPISPHSPQFVTPQTPSSLPSPLTRPSSVAADPPLSSVVFACASSSSDAPLLHNVLNNPNQMYSTGWRSQSVPACVLPDITPVPSEMTDFDMTESDSSNHLVDTESLGCSDNLGQILSFITGLDSPTVQENDIEPSYIEEPIDIKPSYSFPPITALLEGTSDVFDDLSLDSCDAFESIARGVCSQSNNF